MSYEVAVVGVGQTKFEYQSKKTTQELVFEAAKKALDDAGMTLEEIDTVVYGSAPDGFDGINMKGEHVIDAAGALGKPFERVFVGGATGALAPITGYYHVASGLSRATLVICQEKMSPCKPKPQGLFNTIFDEFTERPMGINLIYIFALEMNRYMTVNKIKLETLAKVSVKNKKNAMDNPYAQLPMEITVEDVLNAPVMAYPVTKYHISPSSDGAAAAVLVNKNIAKYKEKPVWIAGVGWCLDSTYWTNRDLAYPKYVEYAARQAYNMAGIKNPQKEIQVAEPYDPFSYKELQHAEGLLLANRGEGWKLIEEGIAYRDGKLPLSPSGGLLGVGNPIAAAGMMKFNEIVLQLRGDAGKRQVKNNPKVGVVQAWGGLMQFTGVLVLKA